MSVEYLDHMGTDLTVVNSARVSFNKESDWEYLDPEYKSSSPWCAQLKEQDVKLINYLAKHAHWTPFAHCFVSFRIKVPMFVAMQLDKHTVGLVTNSVSRRYVDDEPEFWFPKEWRSRPTGSVKQGSSGVNDMVTPAGDLRMWFESQTYEQLNLYNEMIGNSVAPEMARMVLPQSMMVDWIWTGNLTSFFHVWRLRIDGHAQKEAQDFAKLLEQVVEPLFPHSWSALKDASTTH